MKYKCFVPQKLQSYSFQHDQHVKYFQGNEYIPEDYLYFFRALNSLNMVETICCGIKGIVTGVALTILRQNLALAKNGYFNEY